MSLSASALRRLTILHVTATDMLQIDSASAVSREQKVHFVTICRQYVGGRHDRQKCVFQRKAKLYLHVLLSAYIF